MNITDRIGEALLARVALECDRCGHMGTVVRVQLFTKTEAPFGSYGLCRACFADFNWFIVSPPEIPITSSDDSIDEPIQEAS